MNGECRTSRSGIKQMKDEKDVKRIKADKEMEKGRQENTNNKQMREKNNIASERQKANEYRKEGREIITYTKEVNDRKSDKGIKRCKGMR